MRSHLRLVLFALMLVAATAARATVVTHNYSGGVSFLFGSQSHLFQLNDPILVSYTIDTDLPDSNVDPGIGFYSGALQGLSVTLPRLALTIAVGPGGTVQTFNDQPSGPGGVVSDQVFFRGGPGGAGGGSFLGNPLLDGFEVVALEVDFLSLFQTTPSTMLMDDGIPIGRLPLLDPFVIIGTTSGSSFVHFLPIAVPEPSSLLLLLAALIALALPKDRSHHAVC